MPKIIIGNGAALLTEELSKAIFSSDDEQMLSLYHGVLAAVQDLL